MEAAGGDDELTRHSSLAASMLVMFVVLHVQSAGPLKAYVELLILVPKALPSLDLEGQTAAAQGPGISKTTPTQNTQCKLRPRGNSKGPRHSAHTLRVDESD